MVRAIMIVEMAGRPAAHLQSELEKHVGVLRQVKDIEVDRIEVSEAKLIEQKGDKNVEDMFTAFAECEFDVPTFARLAETMFDFMPSSIEVIEPSSVSLDCNEATGLLNNISGRLHRYDEIAKILGERYKQMEGQVVLAKKLLEEKDKEIAKLKGGSKGKVKKVSKKKAAKK